MSELDFLDGENCKVRKCPNCDKQYRLQGRLHCSHECVKIYWTKFWKGMNKRSPESLKKFLNSIPENKES